MKKFWIGVLLGSFIVWVSVYAQSISFRDIQGNEWFAEAVNRLAEKGIIEGYSDGNFGPARGVNRAEIAVMLDRLLEYLENGYVSSEKIEWEKIQLDIPFTAQAPYGSWVPPYDEACEEASLLMVEYFLKNESLSPEQADRELVGMVQWEEANGYGIDVSAEQVGEIAKAYYARDYNVYRGEEVTLDHLKQLLREGYPIIVPVAGQHLNNPNYTGDGPPYHMLVLTGYDSDFFYTHDPGTRLGEDYRYEQQLFFDAIHDWTGSKSTIEQGEKAVLILKP